MNLVNTTRLAAGYTAATDKHGRESLVVVAKGTYGMPAHAGEAPALLDAQLPLVTTDVFTGEPGLSAPLHEIDFAPFKPRCDVLVNGRCHAPAGMPATRVPVGIRVGALVKKFEVVGPRVYEGGPLGGRPGAPRPFTVLPIGYDHAYGGVDRSAGDVDAHRWYPMNHAGVGYHPGASGLALDGLALPHTQEPGKEVVNADGNYMPMAFGPLGRAWQARLRWAGTYDRQWLDNRFPFLPEDFDPRYFQSAPEDQQMDYPRGGEEVVLMNLTPDGRTAFRLPADLGLPVLFVSRTGEVTEVAGVVDTFCIEPEEARFTLAWRASVPLRRNVREIAQVILGRHAQQLERDRARALRMRGKQHFDSLADVVAWSRARRRARVPQDDRV